MGIDAALKAQVLFMSTECIQDFKDGDFVKGAGKLLCSPDLVMGIEQMKPGLLKNPVKNLFANDALKDALRSAMESIPHQELKDHLSSLLEHDFDAEDGVKKFAKKAKKIIDFKPPEHHGFLHNLKEGVSHAFNKSFGGSRGGKSNDGGSNEHSTHVTGAHFGHKHNDKHDAKHDPEQKFEFPGSLLKKLDRNDIIDMIKSVKLPSPVGAIFSKAIDGVLAAELMVNAKPVLDQLQAGKLEEATRGLISNPDLIGGIDRIKPGMLLAPLKNLMAESFIQQAVAKAKHLIPDQNISAKLQQLTEIKFEEQKDVKKFCAQARELAQVPDLDFPNVLLKGMDVNSAINLLRSIKLPSPIGPIFKKAVDAAQYASLLTQAKPVLDKLQAGKIEDAVRNMMSQPPFLAGIDGIKPGMILAPLKALFAQDFIHDAVAKARGILPDVALADKLKQITEIQFDSSEDLKKFCSQARELAEVPDLDFPNVLLKNLDMGAAMSLLKSIKLPSPIGPLFKKAVDAAPLITVKPMLDALQAGKMEEAVTALMSNPGLVMYFDKLKPGMMLAPLKALFAEDFIRDAVAKARETIPDKAVADKLQKLTEIKFESADDLKKFCNEAREMIASQVDQASEMAASQVDSTVSQVVGHCFGSDDVPTMPK
eukprot:90453-Rhodomonas_salina.1